METQASQIVDVDQEVDQFTQKMKQNQAALQKIISSAMTRASTISRTQINSIFADREKEEDLKCKIEEARTMMSNLQENKSSSERELQEMRQRLEKIVDMVSDKERDREELRGKLGEVESRLAEREHQLRQKELQSQELQNHCERGMALYTKYLGLIITRTARSTLVFSFTQISPSDHEKPYLLELTLDSTGPLPPIDLGAALPNMPEIEQRLNETNNLSGCMAYVRAAFKKMAK